MSLTLTDQIVANVDRQLSRLSDQRSKVFVQLHCTTICMLRRMIKNVRIVPKFI